METETNPSEPPRVRIVKLSKTALQDLEEGAFLVSSIWESGAPVYSGPVMPEAMRDEQFSDLSSADVAREPFFVFPSEEDFRQWISQPENLRRMKPRD